ncbi:hypothetical protein ACFQ9X_19825 [Catenulispora yoronensis]
MAEPAAEPALAVPRRAFLRAMRDAGIDADDDALPLTDALAMAAAERMRLAESEDPFDTDRLAGC